MNIQELRFNNWVLNGFGEPIQIKEIISEGNTSGYKVSTLQPIELTPEILEKAGLTHHKRTVSFNDSGFDPINFWYILDGLDEFNQRVYRYDFILGEFKDGFYYQARNRKKKGIKIESVHHLQNLIYALTHQELNINL